MYLLNWLNNKKRVKSRVVSIIQKEFLHIIRDTRSLIIVFLLPITQILMYRYAITFDIREIRLGILDWDRTPASRDVVRSLTSSHYFRVVAEWEKRSEMEAAMLESKVQAALIVSNGFGKMIQTKADTPVQWIVDGANSNTATVAINYAKAFFMAYSLDLNVQTISFPVEVHPRIWYNPDLKSVFFIVPGLMAVIMMMICVMLTSTTIARERETGTMEQILVSPIGRVEIIVGKFLPYVLLALIDALLIVVCARVIFGVPFRGQPLLMLLLIIVYVYAALSMGVFISARVQTQQVAMTAAQISTTLPSVMLSGFIFPIQSMPLILRLVSYVVPARYFLTIVRGIMLKGVGFGTLYKPALFLFGFGTLLLLFSMGRFKTTLE